MDYDSSRYWGGFTMHRKKIFIVIALLLAGLTFYLTITQEKRLNQEDIISILGLPIAKEDILDMKIDYTSNDTTMITFTIRYNESLEKPAVFDISQYENTYLYEELLRVIDYNNIANDDVEIQTYFITYERLFGVRSSLAIYIIIGNCDGEKRMVFYTVFPEHVIITES